MSYHGYAYGQQPGYYPPQAGTSLPYPASNGDAQRAEHVPDYNTYGGAVAQSFETNRNMIPGLNLGLRNDLPQQPPSWVPPPQVEADQIGLARASNQAAHVPQEGAPNGTPAATGEPDGMEEGELSEGELEDLYEPQYTENHYSPPNEPLALQPSIPVVGGANDDTSTRNVQEYEPQGEFSSILEDARHVPY